MLGIFDIHMPLIYGEGRKKALVRLFKEIEKSLNDERPALSLTHLMRKEYTSRSTRPPFSIHDDFQQFNALGGTQNISTGNGNQFPGASFNGPVHFG